MFSVAHCLLSLDCTTYMGVPLLHCLQLVFLCTLQQPWTVSTLQSRKDFRAASEDRFLSCLHHLPARASSRPAQGWISWHTFESKALRVVLLTSVHIIECAMWHAARLSQHMPGLDLSVHCIWFLCHVTSMMVGEKAIQDKWLLFHARRVTWTWASRSWANC